MPIKNTPQLSFSYRIASPEFYCVVNIQIVSYKYKMDCPLLVHQERHCLFLKQRKKAAPFFAEESYCSAEITATIAERYTSLRGVNRRQGNGTSGKQQICYAGHGCKKNVPKRPPSPPPKSYMDALSETVGNGRCAVPGNAANTTYADERCHAMLRR